MASTLTVKDSDNLCTFLASTSTYAPAYNATANDSNHSIALSFVTDNTNPVISLAKDPSTGNYLENSLMVEISWSGRQQTVILVHPDAYGVEWTVGGTKLTHSTPSKQITSGSTIYAKSLRQSGAVPTQTATKVRIRGYWQTNTYPESTTGCYNKPSIIQVGVRYTVDWAAPDLSSYSASNKPVILGYMVIYWKGNWGATDGVTGVGDSVMVAPDVTSLTSNANWWDGVNGHHLKHTVFTIYNKGISPAISTAKAECLSERPTAHAGTGTGNSVKNYSHYSKFDNSDTTQLYQVGFYLENGTSPVVVNNSDFISYQVAGSKVVTPTGSSWIPTNYHLSGWYRKDGTGAWQTTLLTNSAVKNIAVNNNIYFKAKFDPNTVNIVFKPNYPSGSSGTGTDVTKSWVIGTSQSLPAAPATPTKTGYTITFKGWYDATSGGNAVPNPYTVPSSGKTFYAQWTQSKNSYTLTTAIASDSSGMGTVSGGGTKEYDSSVTVTATANTGYQFVKWVFTGSKTGESNTASTTFNMPAGNVTATAHFEARTFTLSFNAKTENYPKSSDDGGQEVTNPSSVTVTYNQKYPTLPSYNNTDFDGWKWDYTFGGWWTDAPVDGVAQGTRVYGNTASELYTTVGNQTLYAFWPRTQKKYNITWIEADLYDNLVLEQDNNVLADTAPSFDQANPVHEGYEFLGWTPVGKDQTGYPKEESQLPVVMETLTYKAVYEPISNHIIFDCQGGTPATFDPVLFNVETIPVVINSTSGGPYEITKVGYKFLGWLPFVNGEPISDTPQLVYRLTDWIDSDITLVAKYIAALSAFNPKPGDPGFDESNPDEDNDNYGIPISALDRNQKYKLKLHVDGDRTSDPVFNISEGVITKVNGVWVWDYESDILTITELEELLNNTVFVMDIWRCIVFRTTGVIKVTLETYDTDGTYLGYDDMDSPFELYDWMTPYIDGENSVDDYSDVVPVESISSIENLDLWANGLEQRFTKRFIGNGKSTISVIMTAHSEGWLDENKTVWGERLYGAVPTVYCVLLKSDDSNGGETYELKYVNSVETQSDYDALFNSSDIDDISYTTKELPVNYNPFPNIQHNASKDYINATLKVRVYDSRHMQPLFDD